MSKLVKTARKYIGVRFRHRGRNPKVGLDCAGPVMCAYKEHGIILPDIKVYGREPHKDGLVKASIQAMGEPIKVAPVYFSDLEVGDVALIRFEIEPHHIVIVADYYLGGFSIIHCDGNHGPYSRVLEQRLDQKTLANFTHLFRRPI